MVPTHNITTQYIIHTYDIYVTHTLFSQHVLVCVIENRGFQFVNIVYVELTMGAGAGAGAESVLAAAGWQFVRGVSAMVIKQ